MSAASVTVREAGEVRGPGTTYYGRSVTSILRRLYGPRATYSPRAVGSVRGVVRVPDRDYGTVGIAVVLATTGPYALEDRPLEVVDADGDVVGTVRRVSVQRSRPNPHGGASTSVQRWQGYDVDGAPIGGPLTVRRHAAAMVRVAAYAPSNI